MYVPVPYHIAAAAIYACILLILALSLYYGRRARRNVKREKVTALPRGFSPLDVQRIFIGKTYPRKLTRALIAHWAQLGFVKVTYIKRNRVTLTCRRIPPAHNDVKAVYFDRGTYVRERELFKHIFRRAGAQITVSLNRPLIKRKDAKYICSELFAAREDEGVYSSKHYKLKVFTFILSLAPFFICGIYLCAVGSFQGMIFPFTMLLGMFCFRFVREIPFLFRLVWSTGWVVPSVVVMIVMFNGFFDPLGLAYAAVATLFIGSFLMIRFVDFREKNNLSDYSDLMNYKKFLLFSGRDKLKDIDYYDALPFLYAFGIKPFVKFKFVKGELPEWYSGERGSLL